MSDYRRLISYIYAYDKDVKGHSVGFAKLESRNGQCKISVSVKKLYMGNAEWDVYLLTGEEEIPIGRFYIRGQGGEFRTIVQTENVERSGYPLSSMHGLSIHGDKAQSRYYMTIWEEPNVHAAELEVEGELQAAEEAKEANETVQPTLTAYVPDAFQADERKQAVIPQAPAPEMPKDIFVQSELQEDVQQVQDMEALLDSVEDMAAEAVKDTQNIMDSEIIQDAGDLSYMGEQPDAVDSFEEDVPADPELQAESENIPENLEEEQPDMDSEMDPEIVSEADSPQRTEPIIMGERSPEEKNWQMYAQNVSRGKLPLWEKLRKRYAKIQAFDYAGGCEILTIKPQDIGLLPRENWVYGNNSFLLHAYYNYRYLILVKLDEPDGSSRYLLGVPGMYYTNEKYMASMFGFPEFILAKKQPHKDGRFGYWYAEVKL